MFLMQVTHSFRISESREATRLCLLLGEPLTSKPESSALGKESYRRRSLLPGITYVVFIRVWLAETRCRFSVRRSIVD